MKMLVNKCVVAFLLWPCFANAQHVSESTRQLVFMRSFDYYFLHEFCATLAPNFSADRLEHKMQEDVRQFLQLSQPEATKFVGNFVSSYAELVSDNDEYGSAISVRIEQFNGINEDIKREVCISMQQERRQQLQAALQLLKSEM